MDYRRCLVYLLKLELEAVVKDTKRTPISVSSFFPEFTCNSPSGDCSSFVGLFDNGPKDAPDYAKAIVLGFASGFSERLVRDVLETVEAPPK